MPSTITQLEENFIQIQMDVEPATLERGLNEAYLKNRNKINIPGFRKGKAPRKFLEAQYGKELFFEDALEIIFPEIIEEAIKTHDLEIVSRPEADIKPAEGGGAVVTAKAYTRPFAEVENYKGLSYVKEVFEATDEDITREIKAEQEKNARIISIADRAAQTDDIVIINFEGFIDGVAFEGGKGEDFELVLGSKSFIDNFEEQIEGKNIGENFDVSVNFPEEYHAPELAGKPAIFKVTLNEIKKKELPELDDDFAQEVSEFDTFEEFKADIIKNIELQNKNRSDRQMEENLLEELRKNIKVSIPEDMLKNETNMLIREFAAGLESRGIDVSQYFQATGMNLEHLRSIHAIQARKNVESRLGLEAIARAENFEISEDEYNAEIDRLAEIQGIKREELVKNIEDGRRYLEEDLKVKKAMEFIKEHSVERPKDETKDENEGEIIG